MFLIAAVFIFFFHQNYKLKSANKDICRLLTDNYINKIDQHIIDECKAFTQDKFYIWQDDFMKDLNLWLASFNISHLHLYNTYENKKMWDGIGFESGIIAKRIFGKWVVTEVHNPNVDIQVGDHILRINNKKISSEHQILTTGGEFLIVRDDEKKQVSVAVTQINYNENMIAKTVNDQWSYLKIPTFKADYFDYPNLEEKLKVVQGRSLILDLRGNLGGNFVSILRLLSGLICEEKRVGKVFNLRLPQDAEYELENDLNDLAQIRTVTQYNPIFLKTFEFKECLPIQKLIVLTNEKSASVTELLVTMLQKNIKDFKSYGTTTAGHMLLAIWYPIEKLGPDILMSIPYAWSTSLDEEILEGKGVPPTHNLGPEQFVTYQQSHDPLLDYVLDEINSGLTARQL